MIDCAKFATTKMKSNSKQIACQRAIVMSRRRLQAQKRQNQATHTMPENQQRKPPCSIPSTSDTVPKTDGVTTETTNSCLTQQSSLDTPTGATSVNMNSTVINDNDPTSSLLAELKCQRELISKLQQQLCFVLSLLGVAEQADQRTVNPQTEQSGNDLVCKIQAVSQPNGQPSWADVVTNSSQKPPQQATNFKQSIIAAVYADQLEQKRRESTLIVSGIQESQTQNDKALFINLCRDELNLQVDVITTKRLGRPLPNKVRPLLVVTRKADEAQHLIAAAKQLRKSRNPSVRTNIYFNRNMTKAEAEASYHARVQRRQAALGRTDIQQNQTTGCNSNNCPNASSTSVLNANAPEFKAADMVSSLSDSAASKNRLCEDTSQPDVNAAPYTSSEHVPSQ